MKYLFKQLGTMTHIQNPPVAVHHCFPTLITIGGKTVMQNCMLLPSTSAWISLLYEYLEIH